MDRDSKRMNQMIASSNIALKEGEHWFHSRYNQKIYVYQFAKELMLAEDVTPEEAIQTSLDFHEYFYQMVIKYDKEPDNG